MILLMAIPAATVIAGMLLLVAIDLAWGNG